MESTAERLTSYANDLLAAPNDPDALVAWVRNATPAAALELIATIAALEDRVTHLQDALIASLELPRHAVKSGDAIERCVSLRQLVTIVQSAMKPQVGGHEERHAA